MNPFDWIKAAPWIACAVLMHDGRVFLVPYNSTTATLAVTGYGFDIDPQIVLSAFWNGF